MTSRRMRLLAVGLAASALAGCASATSAGEGPLQAFAPSSPFNTPTPANAATAANSAQLLQQLIRSGPPVADMYEFGTPVFEATKSTPLRRVRCTDPQLECELPNAEVPIPDNARPAPGSDGAMVVIDPATRTSYEFWRAVRQPDGSWTASSTSRVSLDGDGRHGQTGSGFSLLAGLIRTSEIQSGHIDHALTFASQFTCRDKFVYPAVKTDGKDTAADCLPMGTRIQLDPAVDVAKLPGLFPAERAIAVALQRYGGYIGNSAGAPLIIAFQNPAGVANPYPAAGLQYDYAALPGIPLDRLRVVDPS